MKLVTKLSSEILRAVGSKAAAFMQSITKYNPHKTTQLAQAHIKAGGSVESLNRATAAARQAFAQYLQAPALQTATRMSHAEMGNKLAGAANAFVGVMHGLKNNPGTLAQRIQSVGIKKQSLSKLIQNIKAHLNPQLSQSAPTAAQTGTSPHSEPRKT